MCAFAGAENLNNDRYRCIHKRTSQPNISFIWLCLAYIYDYRSKMSSSSSLMLSSLSEKSVGEGSLAGGFFGMVLSFTSWALASARLNRTPSLKICAVPCSAQTTMIRDRNFVYKKQTTLKNLTWTNSGSSSTARSIKSHEAWISAGEFSASLHLKQLNNDQGIHKLSTLDDGK